MIVRYMATFDTGALEQVEAVGDTVELAVDHSLYAGLYHQFGTV